MLDKLSASLLAATKKVVEESAKKAAEEQSKRIATLESKAMKPASNSPAPRNHGERVSVFEGKEATIPKTDKEKKLAALAEPKDKITHADVMTGRGVKKEEVEQQVDEASENKSNTAGFNKDKFKADWQSGAHPQSPFNPNYKSQIATKPGEKAGFDSKKISTGTVYSRKPVKEDALPENKDTPGNGYEHQCAVHVKSEQFGEGKTLFSQHADPAEDGSIAWYDVMFEHGIEKMVPTAELEIIVSESHMNHKKKPK